VTDSTGLSCNAAACNSANYVELLCCICESQRLSNDELQSFKTEVVVDISVVDCDFTCSLIQSYSCNRAFSSACTVKICCLIVHLRVLLPYISQFSGF